MRFFDIEVPQIGVNDDEVLLGQLLCQNGTKVGKGTPLAVMETSKLTEEYESEVEGYIYYCAEAMSKIKVGTIFAVVCDEYNEKKVLDYINSKTNVISKDDEGSKCSNITDKARKLIEENNLDISIFPTDKIIRAKDVLSYIGIKKNDVKRIKDTKKNKLILLGAGNLSKMIIDIIRHDRAYVIHGISDSNYPSKLELMGYPVLGDNEILKKLIKEGYNKLVNCVAVPGNTQIRGGLFEKYSEMGFEFPNIIHSKAIVEVSASMGEGNLIMAGAIIGSCAQLGNDCLINSGAIVSHDCIIGNHSHIAPGAVLAGDVSVGENSLVGMNATVYMGVKIGNNVIINNGCNVFKDVPDNTIVR